MKTEHRVTLEELAGMVGISVYTLRTWITSYKFAKYLRNDNFFSDKAKLSVAINKKFCKEFISYLALKSIKKKDYAKNFCTSLEALNCKFL